MMYVKITSFLNITDFESASKERSRIIKKYPILNKEHLLYMDIKNKANLLKEKINLKNIMFLFNTSSKFLEVKTYIKKGKLIKTMISDPYKHKLFLYKVDGILIVYNKTIHKKVKTEIITVSKKNLKKFIHNFVKDFREQWN